MFHKTKQKLRESLSVVWWGVGERPEVSLEAELEEPGTPCAEVPLAFYKDQEPHRGLSRAVGPFPPRAFAQAVPCGWNALPLSLPQEALPDPRPGLVPLPALTCSDRGLLLLVHTGVAEYVRSALQKHVGAVRRMGLRGLVRRPWR